MSVYFDLAPALFVVVTFVTYFCQRAAIEKLMILPKSYARIDMFLNTNISISLSTGLLSVFVATGSARVKGGTDFLLLYLAFFIGLFMSTVVLRSMRPGFAGTEFVSKTAVNRIRELLLKKDNHKIFVVLFVAYIAYRLFVGYILATRFGSAGSRLIFARQNRALNILTSGLGLYLSFSAIFYFLYRKGNVDRVIYVLLILAALTSGSRSALVLFIVQTMYIKHVFSGSRRPKLIVLISLGVLGLTVVFLVFLYWTHSLSITPIMERLLGSGDIYYYALVGGNYTQLYGHYNALLYVLHPFIAIFGLRGYDYPLGATIIGTAGLPVTGTGPNPELPVLLMVLNQGNVAMSLLESLLVGTGVGLAMYAGIKLFFAKRGSIEFRIVAVNVLFFTSLQVYQDIGFFEFAVVEAVVVLALFVLVRAILFSARSSVARPLLRTKPGGANHQLT